MRTGLNKNGQSLAWYACSALLLAGEEDPGSVRGSFSLSYDGLPPRIHKAVVNEDPLGEVPHWPVVPEVDLGVVSLWLGRDNCAAHRDRSCCFSDNLNSLRRGCL